MPTPQARYWIITLPVEHHESQPTLTGDLVYLKGQKEQGAGGLLHWQFIAVFNDRVTLRQCKSHFCPQAHCEKTRSAAANAYVWKDDTAIDGTRFELGALPISRARKEDWDRVRRDAIAGNWENVPSDILIRNYTNLQRLYVDNAVPVWRHDINVNIYWGESGVGKTRRAWHEAGDPESVYIKNPNTKWWDGYKGQQNVIIDEFVGRIDISYLLLWFDRYPCNVEVKGFQRPLKAVNFWVTSNLNPRTWYPDAAQAQQDALLRRCNITQVLGWVPPNDDEDELLALLNA